MAARLSCSPRAPLLALVSLVACVVLTSVSGASNYTAVIKCADCAKVKRALLKSICSAHMVNCC